jgi:Asp-tRNA(Asn)/Glu-tRNA(Gln) amidotransferase A subunit family amidase
VVAKFKAAGAIIVGHANMPDLANSDTNRSSSFGRTGNAYDVRFSPGGSSGGVVTAVAANMAVLGNGTDTGNSIRMPAATSALVGVFPTRGLVSIAGIAPLDWLLDNTGPIARTVTDAAIALAVMAGEDPLDPRTVGSPVSAQRAPYEPYLKATPSKASDSACRRSSSQATAFRSTASRPACRRRRPRSFAAARTCRSGPRRERCS